MHKKILITFSLCIIIGILCGYKIYINRIDTRYAINFARAFLNYNIDDVDSFLNNDTVLICNSKKSTYKKLRKNVKIACNEKQYEFSDGSSYGYGNNRFRGGSQKVNVRLSGKFRNSFFSDCMVTMIIKKTGPFTFCVESLECDEPIFEYLFYGN